MIQLCYFKEIDSEDGTTVYDQGLVIFDVIANEPLNFYRMSEDEGVVDLFKSRPDLEVITLKEYSETNEQDNPDYDVDNREDDDNRRYIYSKYDLVLYPYHSNTINMLPIDLCIASNIYDDVTNAYNKRNKKKEYVALAKQLKAKQETFRASRKKLKAEAMARLGDMLRQPPVYAMATELSDEDDDIIDEDGN